MHFLENFISIQTQEKTHLETPGGKHQKLSLQIIIPHSSLFPYQSSFLHNLIIFQTWYLPVHIPNCFWRLQCEQIKQRTLSKILTTSWLTDCALSCTDCMTIIEHSYTQYYTLHSTTVIQYYTHSTKHYTILQSQYYSHTVLYTKYYTLHSSTVIQYYSQITINYTVL